MKIFKKLVFKIKFFFNIVVKSLTKFSYYKEVEKAKLKFSLKYLFFLYYTISLIGSIVFAVSISVFVLPRVPGFVSTFESKAKSLYPQGLIVTVKDGQVSTNQVEPFYIDTLKELNLGSINKHLVTIDTKATPSNIKDENTVVLITKDSVATLDSNNSYKVYPIDTGTNYTINQLSYNDLIAKISPYLKYISPILVALIVLSLLLWPLLIGALSFLGQLIYLVIFTAVFYLVTKLMKKTFEFKKLYQLAIHASTLPILLGLIVSSLGVHMPFLLGSIILFVFMILVINQFDTK